MLSHYLVGKVYAGYTIIKQGSIAVIGECQTPYGNQYVTWSYWTRNDVIDYGWGRYGNREYVEECFGKKERGEYSGD